jgi:hypothetical protein
MAGFTPGVSAPQTSGEKAECIGQSTRQGRRPLPEPPAIMPEYYQVGRPVAADALSLRHDEMHQYRLKSRQCKSDRIWDKRCISNQFR